jgi:lactate permease
LAADGPELNIAKVLLSALPILVLLATILALKWGAPRAGAVAWLVVAGIALLFFGADSRLLAVGSSKGLSLSLFVLSIIWTSVLLYNVIDQQGGIEVIGRTMTRLVSDPLAQALVVGWAFAGFMQGIAGFGVPVAVVAPLLALMGFSPARAAAIVLVGHAWAVTFGSLGSSYYTIQLVTGIDGGVIGPHMAAMFAMPIILTGFAVAHLQGGMASVRRGAPAILIMGSAMAAGVWVMAVIGMPQIASIVPGLLGCGVGWLVSRPPLLKTGLEAAASAKVPAPVEASPKGGSGPGFHLAFLPYYLLLALSVLSQVPAVKSFGADLRWGLDYPATETALGFTVDAQDSYAPIRLLRHPAPLILLALALTYLVYRAKGRWRAGAGLEAFRRTYAQCVPTSVGVAAMVMMALVMTDTGMTALLGRTIADGTGPVFALFSPYIGVLGTFMTGSNTNSNVMFGALQLETANALGLGAVTVASVQSIGGSLGSSIAPAKVLVGTAIVGLSGRENEVLRRTIPYCLGIVLLVGIEAWILLNVFSAR